MKSPHPRHFPREQSGNPTRGQRKTHLPYLRGRRGAGEHCSRRRATDNKSHSRCPSASRVAERQRENRPLEKCEISKQYLWPRSRDHKVADKKRGLRISFREASTVQSRRANSASSIVVS